MDKIYAEKMITEYGKSLYSFCLYTTNDRDKADDLYQQTFITVFEKDELESVSNPKAYLVSIAANIWKNTVRKIMWRRKIADIVFLEEDELAKIATKDPSVEEIVERRQEEIELKKQFFHLPEKQRIVILMFYMENMSIEEISAALHIPSGTVKSRLNKAKIRLKERLTDGK